jgi:hypothetical protein
MGKQIERDEKATQLRDEIQKLRGGYRKRKLRVLSVTLRNFFVSA